jgi:endonuclease YncB( thermonuclease family)
LKKIIYTVIIALAGLILVSIAALSAPDSEIKPEQCKGSAACFSGKVTAITDGDTIKVDGKAIRLALSSSPELHESGGINAREFTLAFCPPGTIAIVDEDDGQQEGSFGRMIAAVYCRDMLLNAALLDFKHATISERFCSSSEFGNDDWALKNGC